MTRPWEYQSGVPLGDGDRQTCGNRRPLPRGNSDIDSGVKIDRRVADMCCRGDWQFPIE